MVDVYKRQGSALILPPQSAAAGHLVLSRAPLTLTPEGESHLLCICLLYTSKVVASFLCSLMISVRMLVRSFASRLDEPLSNLDAKLRTSMRTEILKLHKKLATTFIYVTHDQTAAMTMGLSLIHI